ncbi:MAG: hypothetical protein L3J10_02580 [Sulfurimonas sp.]|nr:hypothetical protein [Sulfurimonas sp.]
MKNFYNNKRKLANTELRCSIDTLLNEGDTFLKNNFSQLKVSQYNYDINEAIDELCLDKDVINQLLEDYVIQILKSKITFYKYIQELKQAEYENIDIDYSKIKDLAHKNLGVAKNLRIKDAKILLEELMKEDDLDYLRICVKALEISAVKLNPLCAYETMNLIQVKNSL